jgi:hypothetical protein
MYEPFDLHVDDGVTVKWLLSLVLASYLKHSRDAESVKEASTC